MVSYLQTEFREPVLRQDFVLALPGMTPPCYAAAVPCVHHLSNTVPSTSEGSRGMTMGG
jgi:hypothetical protein